MTGRAFQARPGKWNLIFRAFIRIVSSVLPLVLLLFALGFPGCSPEPEERAAPGSATRRAVLPVWVSADQDIGWKSWSASSFQEAQERDCPVLLYLAAPGGEGMFAAAGTSVRALLEERFVAVRADPFRRPDIARRYPAGGWPSLAVLWPDGRAFALAVDVPPRNMELFLWRTLENYEKQRKVIERKLRQAEKEASRAMAFEIEVDQVYGAVAAAFDTLHGGFGRGRKFPEVSVLRFLLEYYTERREEEAWEMLRESLDALLDSSLRDPVEGGFFAYSHTPDWQTPALEKDALDQAGLVLVLLGAAEVGGAGYAAAARDLITYIEQHLFDAARGVFRGRQVGVRSGSGTVNWWTDPVVYAARNAVLIRACAAAATRLQDERAARMARAATRFLSENCIDAGGVVDHVCGGAERSVAGLLEDQVLVSAALLDFFDRSGEERFRKQARETIHFMEEHLFDPARQAFFDRPVKMATEGVAWRRLFPYCDRMLPAGNVLAAELYARRGDLVRAGVLLGGRRLAEAPGRASSSHARAILRCERLRRMSL